jgi:hypothetical protein
MLGEAQLPKSAKDLSELSCFDASCSSILVMSQVCDAEAAALSLAARPP